MTAATRVALGAVATLAACGVEVGPAGAWQSAALIAPPLAIEVHAAPTPPGPFRQANPPATDPLRVVTYNIDEEQPDVTAEALAAGIAGDPQLATAGLFLIQEAQQYAGEPTSRMARLAELLGLDYVFIPAHVLPNGDTQGLAVMTAYPLTNLEKLELPLVDSQKKIAVAADVQVGEHVLHVIDVHLDLYANAATRLAELRPAVIDAPTSTLVSGDFNMGWLQWITAGVPVLTAQASSDQAPIVDSYMAALGFAAPAAGAGPTAHSHGYAARADAFYTRGLAVTFGAIERVGPSDHWPMWMDVTLP